LVSTIRQSASMSRAERVRQLLPAASRFGDIRWLEETGSTNTVVVTAARAGAAEGLVVVADHQTAGRGRLDRRWEAPPGSALLCSILLRPVDLPVSRRHLVSAAVGLAAREACAAVGAPFPDLKWPNDLLAAGSGAKLAGILAEAVDDAVVVGLGCNVATAPPGATGLEEVAGGPVSREELLAELLGALDGRLDHWDLVAAEYRTTCATVGRRVRIEMASGISEGDAVAVDDDGALVVRFPDGVRPVHAGDVVHVRPGGGATIWSGD
jgi:BirA family biotin operon repressor/biotin-[acetyl-CoA-carboxylase] ligase